MLVWVWDVRSEILRSRGVWVPLPFRDTEADLLPLPVLPPLPLIFMRLNLSSSSLTKPPPSPPGPSSSAFKAAEMGPPEADAASSVPRDVQMG